MTRPRTLWQDRSLPRGEAMRTLALALLVLLQNGDRAPENDSIRERDLRADLFFLAGDLMRWRLTGTDENALAAEFIKGRFERLGLRPAARGGSFFQDYNLAGAPLGKENRLEVRIADGAALRLSAGQDFYPLSMSASGAARGPVVFCGFGITAPEAGYDDFRGQDLRGKIVLVFDHEPGENDPASPLDGLV